MEKIIKYKIIVILTMITLVSCVGTIKDQNAQLGKINDDGNGTTPIVFNGLTSVNPISHDKVELFFFPARGVQSNITYEIYINGSPIASKLSGKTLVANTKGVMSTIVSNLSINTTYTFNMKAIEVGTSSSSSLDPAKALTATTFANETANFQGISNVVLGAGESGKTTAIISWLQAVTKGSTIFPTATDPVAYEVKYISQLGGVNSLNDDKYLGPDKVTIQNPTPLSSSPSLSTETSMIIGGLNPGTTYYFQVRAIHKNYALYGSDKSYKREMNTKYLAIKTLDSSGIFDFATNQVTLTSPLGEDGLTKLNVSWLPASGSFNHYRICYTKIANPNTNPNIVPIDDHLVDDNSLDIGSCLIKSADDNFHQIISLVPYSWYQAKVVACKTVTCDFGNRIMSDLLQKRVISNVSPFGGILSFENPVLDTAVNDIKIHFNPPVTSAGYINQLRVYCYANATDPHPVRIDNLSYPTSATGKTNCNGLTIQTNFPSTLSDFSRFKEIALTLPPGGIDGIKQYCFSLVPTIESPYLTQSDLTNAIVRCVIPQIKTPNILQFGGRNEVCTPVNQDLQITWSTPLGGLYSKFIVFYQEKLTGLEFFNYQDAINEYNSGTPVRYHWIDNINKALIVQNISGLIPGSKYNIGVLPYLNYGSTKLYGQYNYNVGECSLPLPKARFKEWMQIISLGPKEDGLTPADPLGKKKYFLETLNTDNQPVEIVTTATDFKIPDSSNPLAAARLGSIVFDGIYGRYNSNIVNPIHQYSNSGIIKLVWKDVSLFNDTDTMNNHLDTGVSKNNRKFGYRVYRSEDNKMTWQDLTAKGASNPNQNPLNAGLIQNTSYIWHKRNNSPNITTQIASFTDYSVKASEANGDTDHARVYYYKIVPVFNGIELQYDDTTNPNHNVLKVILPPKNMALVSRLMANRTICNEMDLPLKMKAAEYYSCKYDGVGARSLEPPYTVNDTVYDQGGDLLIDRFELGIPFTRGDASTSNSSSEYNGTKLNFKGLASNGSKYTGCFNNTSTDYEASSTNGTLLTDGTYSYSKVMPGDCIGKDKPILASRTSTVCSDPTRVWQHTFIYPGSPGSNGENYASRCGELPYTGFTLTNMANSNSLLYSQDDLAETQGEFGALYFIRNGNGSGFDQDTDGLFNYPAGNARYMQYDHRSRKSLAFFNLPYFDIIGNMHPRWINVNHMFGNISLGNPSSGFLKQNAISLYNKTVSQVISSSGFYDNTTVLAPSASLLINNRFNKDTTVLGRIFSSNASKLPPMMGLSHTQFHNLCSTYKVQVGIETNSLGFVPTGGAELQKRLMRKSESNVAAAWPETWSNSKVTDIEKGVDASGLGCNGPSKITPNGTATLYLNSALDNFIPWANSTSPFSLTGSAGTYSSENCSSRFGVQDLAGNLREYNSDTFFCTFLSRDPNAHKPTQYLGDSQARDINHSILYDGTYTYDRNIVQPWVSGYPDSGSCSSVEIGGNHTGDYVNSGAFNSIYLPDSKNINSNVVSQAKPFDQDSVLTTRNGDGTFLDFGLQNLGPVLNTSEAFNLPGLFFSVPLGIPLGCSGGCAGGNGSDNKLVASDYHSSIPGSSYLPGETHITNFPINNSTFTNYGVEEIQPWRSAFSNDELLPHPYYYIAGINDTGIAATNTPYLVGLDGPSPNPGDLYSISWKISRKSYLRFTTGGSVWSEPGRYTFFMDGNDDTEERALSDRGSRCSILIEE